MSIYKSIFLSHCHSDKEFANKLANDLKLFGVKVWIDEAEIKIGDSLLEKIREGIYLMDYLAVILSPESVRSQWVRKEVELAMNVEIKGKEVKVLPLLYKKCELPLFLEGKYYADFTSKSNYENSMKKLLERIGLENKSINIIPIVNYSLWNWKLHNESINLSKLLILSKAEIILHAELVDLIIHSLKQIFSENDTAFIFATDNPHELYGVDPENDEAWEKIHTLGYIIDNLKNRLSKKEFDLLKSELYEICASNRLVWKYINID